MRKNLKYLLSSTKEENAHSSSSSIGMSANVFQRFILASRLLTRRGPVLESFDLELLLRTMTGRDEEPALVYYIRLKKIT